MRPKLKDIAKICGISITQVSRAINDYPDVSLETKNLVKTVADRMGYKTNRTIIRQKSYEKKISLLILNFDASKESKSITYTNLISGVERFCQEYEFEFNIIFLNEKEKKQNTFEELASKRQIFNCIIVGLEETDKYYKEIKSSKRNIVVLDNQISSDNNNIACVTGNDIKGMEKITTHLIEEGKKRFLFIGGKEDLFVTNQR
jgi:DNA-binding LacI/PurR family transcriptional regulator